MAAEPVPPLWMSIGVAMQRLRDTSSKVLYYAIVVSAAAVFSGCQEPQTVPSLPDFRTPVPTSASLPRSLARIGLSCVASVNTSTGTRTAMLSRAELSGLLPQLGAQGLADTLRSVLYVRHFEMNAGVATKGLVTCVVPENPAYSEELRNAIREGTGGAWRALVATIKRTAEKPDLRSAKVVAAEQLRVLLLPGARYAGRTRGTGRSPGPMPTWTDENSDPPPVTLPELQAWATPTQWILDFNFAREVASRSKSFSDIIDWDWYLYGPDCASANDLWYGIDAEANSLQVDADNIGLVTDAVESLTCVPIQGYPLCIDFFIMSSHAFNFLGDNRNFADTANFSSSRIQIYINPVTRQKQVKWNGSIMIAPGGPPGYVTMLDASDSADMYNEATDLVVDTTAQGRLHVSAHIANNFCIRPLMILCPRIDAELEFIPDATRPGGYRVLFNRDAFPSMGVYIRKQDGSGWHTLREDAGHTQHPLTDWMHLISALRNSNELPQGCSWT